MFGNPANLFQSTGSVSQEGESKEQARENAQLRAKKEELVVSIRKGVRDNEIKKRRHINMEVVETLPVKESTVPMSPLEIKIKNWRERIFAVEEIKLLHEYMKSDDIEKMYYGQIGVRKLLSAAEFAPPIQQILDERMLPQIIRFATQSQQEQLQLEAVWTLSSLVSGDCLQTQTVVQKVGLQFFMKFLDSKNSLIVEHSLWAIGNLAADRAAFRDQFINYGILNMLFTIINTSKNTHIVTQSCWSLSNIIRLNPIPADSVIEPAIVILSQVMMCSKVTDISVVKDMLWSISYIIELDERKLQILFQTGISDKLIELAMCGIDAITVASLRNIGHICFGPQYFVNHLLSKQILSKFNILLDLNKPAITKEICWALSNIAVSSPNHVVYLFNHTDLISKVFDIFTSNSNEAIKLDCGYLFANTIKFGDPAFFVQFFLSHNMVEIFLDFIENGNSVNIKEMGLKGINSCLKLGMNYNQSFGGKNSIMEQLVRKNGIDILQAAQDNKNSIIYDLASRILEGYFVISDPLKQ